MTLFEEIKNIPTIIGVINYIISYVKNSIKPISFYVRRDTDSVVGGVKTFSISPEAENPTTDTQLVNKQYVDDNFPQTYMTVTGNETVNGTKGFTHFPDVNNAFIDNDAISVDLFNTELPDAYASIEKNTVFTGKVTSTAPFVMNESVTDSKPLEIVEVSKIQYIDGVALTPPAEANNIITHNGENVIFRPLNDIYTPLNSNATVTGTKTFSRLTVPNAVNDAEVITEEQLNSYVPINMQTTNTDQTLTGEHTFLAGATVPLPTQDMEAANLAYLQAKTPANVVYTNRDATITAQKTFTRISAIDIDTTNSNSMITKGYVTDNPASNVVITSQNDEIGGVKTFPSGYSSGNVNLPNAVEAQDIVNKQTFEDNMLENTLNYPFYPELAQTKTFGLQKNTIYLPYAMRTGSTITMRYGSLSIGTTVRINIFGSKNTEELSGKTDSNRRCTFTIPSGWLYVTAIVVNNTGTAVQFSLSPDITE